MARLRAADFDGDRREEDVADRIMAFHVEKPEGFRYREQIP
jgi:hypothetical protein